MPAGPFLAPDQTVPFDMPAFCRVQGVSKPSNDSEIKFEVWLPTDGWNGKFDHGGNGGYGRGFALPGSFMAAAIQRGYAAAGTDMGHPLTVGYDATWAYGHPDKIVDWGYRANHVTAVNAKVIIASLYGTGPKYSYFNGCSDGGREALMAAQRFPHDFDGIVAGAPANNWTRQAPTHIWQATAMLDAPLATSKLPLIAAAAVAACDANDGVVDGLIDDPRQCSFNPASLQCTGADTTSCLTSAEVEAVAKIYQGPRNPRTGELLFPGMEPGSEALWTFALSPTVGALGPDFYRYFVYNDPAWDMRTLDFDAGVTLGDVIAGPIISSIDPDLGEFNQKGGKLILYHGWADQALSPRATVNYYESVIQDVASGLRRSGSATRDRALRQTQSFARLFMVPGMQHCSGGPGVTAFDALTALEQWVEKGQAPRRLEGYRGSGLTMMKPAPKDAAFTRPLCPYPQVVRWNGRGNTNDARSFACVDAEAVTGQ